MIRTRRTQRWAPLPTTIITLGPILLLLLFQFEPIEFVEAQSENWPNELPANLGRSVVQYPNPYGYNLTSQIKDTLNFTITLTVPYEYGSSSDGVEAIWTDLLNAFRLKDQPEEWRIQVQAYFNYPLTETSYWVLIGPPIGHSQNSTSSMWEFFQTTAAASHSPFYSFAAFPVLSQMDARKTQLVSYACDDGDVQANYECNSHHDDNEKHLQIVEICLGVIIPMLILLCFGYCCLRAAKSANLAQERAVAAAAERAAQEERAAAAARLQALSANVLIPIPNQLHYPGSPFRLSDGLPPNVQPVKYGDVIDEEEEDSPTSTHSDDELDPHHDPSSPTTGNPTARRDESTASTVVIHVDQ